MKRTSTLLESNKSAVTSDISPDGINKQSDIGKEEGEETGRFSRI